MTNTDASRDLTISLIRRRVEELETVENLATCIDLVERLERLSEGLERQIGHTRAWDKGLVAWAARGERKTWADAE